MLSTHHPGLGEFEVADVSGMPRLYSLQYPMSAIADSMLFKESISQVKPLDVLEVTE